MSQITIPKSPTKLGNQFPVVGSDAKNALPTKVEGDLPHMDLAGLSWIFLDDPLNFGDYA